MQDREIRFDVPIRELKCRSGEEIIEMMDPVEDTKGNNGDQVRARGIYARRDGHGSMHSIPGRASCYQPKDHVGIKIE